MAKNLYQRVLLDNGTEAVVHINRRGCNGPWTNEDADALDALVRVVMKAEREAERPEVPDNG